MHLQARVLAVLGTMALLLATDSQPAPADAAAGTKDAPPGLAVGVRAPAFKLTGHDGQEYALADLLKRGKVALVFHRSAEW